MAIAIMLRFYNGGLSFDDIMGMTLRQFDTLWECIAEINKLENADSSEHTSQPSTSMTGAAGFEIAKRVLPRKK